MCCLLLRPVVLLWEGRGGDGEEDEVGEVVGVGGGGVAVVDKTGRNGEWVGVLSEPGRWFAKMKAVVVYGVDGWAWQCTFLLASGLAGKKGFLIKRPTDSMRPDLS